MIERNIMNKKRRLIIAHKNDTYTHKLKRQTKGEKKENRTRRWNTLAISDYILPLINMTEHVCPLHNALFKHPCTISSQYHQPNIFSSHIIEDSSLQLNYQLAMNMTSQFNLYQVIDPQSQSYQKAKTINQKLNLLL